MPIFANIGIGGGTGGGASNFLSVDASAFDAWSANGAAYKIDSVEASDGSVVDFAAFTFDEATQQGIQLMIRNTNNFFTTANFKARLKLRRETAGDTNYDVHMGVLGRFITADPDVSQAVVIPADTVRLSVEGDLYDSDWITVPCEGSITDTCILVIDVLRIADHEYDTLDGLAQIVGVEFEFNQ